MIPPSFDYAKPASVDDAIAVLHKHGTDARVLAGGQSLLVQLKARSVRPTILVDISGLTDLRQISRDNGTLRIGAAVTENEIAQSKEAGGRFPLFADTASVAADPMIRNRATFVGALALADPAGDWPAVALALDARIETQGKDGRRTIPANEFFRDAFTTALQPGELVTGVTLQVPHARPGMAYRKLRHPASGYALVGVAVVVDRAGDGTCSDCRVAITGAGSRPIRATAVEAALHGQRLSSEAIADSAERACDGLDLVGDLFASPEYRGSLARTFVKRALHDALAALNSTASGGDRDDQS